MKITFDPVKRDATLANRGLDMARAGEVFDDAHLTVPDIRFDYGENRFVTIGSLDGRMVVLAWTRRAGAVRIISLRKANEREQKNNGPRL
jgi:uncharacterized DUF497 family protein